MTWICLCTGAVELKPGTLTIRRMEKVKADLAGLATADIANNEAIGTIKFKPML